MLATILVLAAAAGAAAIDLPRLFRKGWTREGTVYAAMLAAGAAMSVAAANVARAPSSVNVIVSLFKPVADRVFSFMGWKG
ncbi:hypothetical protein J19TS2_26360 [Cohnella xylanilytica]|uniref:Uncharacterized protein n=1 Tax=Cohnella xylanilytica TaxID=557555 RepID=A0A841TNK0_9BACL|nr:hypothetical protein [Cohnella xylanilytica]MBB6689827.1 hypothetical protein [Cohnella xylanilytica]GIO13081.1 hypothetical protein J19TS2_26360 [Cohnella xylanilytica]